MSKEEDEVNFIDDEVEDDESSEDDDPRPTKRSKVRRQEGQESNHKP